VTIAIEKYGFEVPLRRLDKLQAKFRESLFHALGCIAGEKDHRALR
jgi:hypothetical protein